MKRTGCIRELGVMLRACKIATLHRKRRYLPAIMNEEKGRARVYVHMMCPLTMMTSKAQINCIFNQIREIGRLRSGSGGMNVLRLVSKKEGGNARRKRRCRLIGRHNEIQEHMTHYFEWSVHSHNKAQPPEY